MKFYLMRHGNTKYNGQGLLLGKTDIGLLDTNDPNIIRWKDYLKTVSIQNIIHSGMIRTRDTAELINQYLDYDISVNSDSRLRELDFGEWELKSYDWLYKNQQDRLSEWIDNPYKNSPPSGETLNELKDRLTSCLDEWSQKDSISSALIVTHGGPIRLLWSLIDNIPFYEKKVLPASLYCLDWGKKAITEIDCNYVIN